MSSTIISVAEPQLEEGPASAPGSGSGSTLDKTEGILNDILFVHSNID